MHCNIYYFIYTHLGLLCSTDHPGKKKEEGREGGRGWKVKLEGKNRDGNVFDSLQVKILCVIFL